MIYLYGMDELVKAFLKGVKTALWLFFILLFIWAVFS